MAQRIQVLLVCDLHDDDTPGDETVSFSLDGVGYEVDLCSEHAAGLRDALAPYVGAGRRVGGRASGGRRGRSAARGGSAGNRSADIRAWARAKGIEISERGRIPASVVEQYEAAH